MNFTPVRLLGPLALRWLAAFLLLSATCAAQTPAERPYVVLVSLDGFRDDYADLYDAKNLKAFRTEGVAASMIPSFPSVTFPNHWSIITGLYPEHHGIVGNRFYDPERMASFINSRNSTEGFWYGGTPLWILAEKQGVRAASYFWVGSDAEIRGVRPSLFKPFDDKVPAEERIQTVLNWLGRPESERPHFITLYLSDTDHSGHTFGPLSEETRKAVQNLDRYMGELRAGVKSLGLPINLIIVSDHGMQLVDQGEADLSPYIDLNKVHSEGAGAFVLLYAQDENTVEQTYRSLKGRSPHFEVYRRDETPAEWHYRGNPRIGDLVVAANDASFLTLGKMERPPPMGEHGYDARTMPTMRAVFFAVGPNVKPAAEIEPFENVNVYPFIAKILGLTLPADLDGSESVLEPIYRK